MRLSFRKEWNEFLWIPKPNAPAKKGTLIKMKTKNITGKGLAWILTLLYFTSYVTRINFAAIIQEIVTQTSYLKTDLSIILVVLSITYGAGQIINGWLGDKIDPKSLILIGLVTSTML